MAAATAGSHASVDRRLLVPVMVLVMAGCLLIWAAAGVALSRHLENARAARRFNRLMGACLVVFAVSLCRSLFTATAA